MPVKSSVAPIDRPRALFVITIIFAIIYLIISVIIAMGLRSEYYGRVYIRDRGVNSLGIVTKKYSEYDHGSTFYYIDFKYRPPNKDRSSNNYVYAGRREVSRENFMLYNQGSQIPIRYDYRDYDNVHLNIQGRWSNNRLIWSSVIEFILDEVMILFVVLLFWIVAVGMYRLFFVRPKLGIET